MFLLRPNAKGTSNFLPLDLSLKILCDVQQNITNEDTRNNANYAPCNSNKKKGIGLTIRPNPQDGSCSTRIPIINALNVHWNYGWNYDRSPCQPTSSTFIPMAWNGGRNISDLRNRINNASIPLYVSNGTTRMMLGFNEPDHAGQANMSVAVAIERWIALQDLGIPLVSPSAGNAEGTWMKEFMGNATALNLRIDYVGVHSYSGVSFTLFVNRMTRIYNLYRKPLVLTEFALADWTATSQSENKLNPCQVLSFMKQALPWLEEIWWIHSYAWFPFSQTSVVGWPSAHFDENNTLTILGQYHQSVNNQNPNGDDVSCL
jgi:Glycosyl hydrolase catalytic core